MDRIILDNPVSSYLLFLLSLFFGILMSLALYFLCKKFRGPMFRRIKSIVIMLVLSISTHVGSQFFDISTDVYHSAFTIAKILYVLSFTWLFIKLSYVFIERINRIKHVKDTALLSGQVVSLLKKVSFFFFGIAAMSMVLNILGFNIFSIVTGLGIGGLAVALGAQEILSNIFGGITIFISGIIKPGDFVEIDSHSGYIDDIGMRTTRIRRLDGKTIIMPNSQIVKSTIVNHSSEKGLIQTYVIPLKYSLSAETVKKASDTVRRILEEDANITDKNSISVGFYKFDAYAMNLYVSFAISDLKFSGEIKERFHYRVKQAFDSEKIEFAYPTQTIELAEKKQI
ncbi:MAG: mechanosensitive ion channel family protein [bacterium]|nr:mechanosensitive ion channel family protein [bacterium]